MRIMMSGLLLIAAVLGLAGCSTMNEQACLVTDWHAVGFEDGTSGRGVGNVARYRQACTRHGVVPDLAEYRAGHGEGVLVFCRAGNGFEVGRRGYQYQGVCPAELEPSFLAAYADGRELYELESAVRSVENQIASRHRRIEEINRELASASAAIIADGTSAETRAELLLSSAAMAKEQGQISEEITSLEQERVLLEADLRAYRQTLAFVF